MSHLKDNEKHIKAHIQYQLGNVISKYGLAADNKENIKKKIKLKISDSTNEFLRFISTLLHIHISTATIMPQLN